MSVIPVLVKREFTSRVKGTAYILTTVIGVLVLWACPSFPNYGEDFQQLHRNH